MCLIVLLLTKLKSHQLIVSCHETSLSLCYKICNIHMYKLDVICFCIYERSRGLMLVYRTRRHGLGFP